MESNEFMQLLCEAVSDRLIDFYHDNIIPPKPGEDVAPTAAGFVVPILKRTGISSNDILKLKPIGYAVVDNQQEMARLLKDVHDTIDILDFLVVKFEWDR